MPASASTLVPIRKHLVAFAAVGALMSRAELIQLREAGSSTQVASPFPRHRHAAQEADTAAMFVLVEQTTIRARRRRSGAVVNQT